MKITVLREAFCPVQLDRVLADCGHNSAEITVTERMVEVDLDRTDVLVMSMDACNVFGMLNGKKVGTVPDFVARGGICWILHQEREGWDASWLPPELRQQLHIDLKYLPKMIAFRRNTPQRSAYIGPWLLERDHQVFHRPHFLDEADFAEWRIEHDGLTFLTTAFNVVTRHPGWQVLAGYEDVRTPLRDGALILQARHGRGLYFWTQLLSPGLVWSREGSREKSTWRKLIVNLLTYFREFRSDRTAGLTASLATWSVKTGDAVIVTLRPETGFIPAGLTIAVSRDDAEPDDFREVPFEIDAEGSVRFRYTLSKAGTYRLRATLASTDGRTAIADQFVKAVDEAWRCRFTIHHHYGNDWVTEHLGQVYGSARRWRLDAIFLASGLFYQSRERYQVIDETALKLIDQPAVRIFPGQETHPHHQYGLDEGNTDLTRDSRRHLATMGCPTIICDANYFEDDTIARVHAAGGLAIVAHTNPGDPWWTNVYRGHRPDGVCVENGAFADWDRMLLQGRLFPAVRGSDSGPGEWSGGNANTVWLREPLSMRALMKAAINGRISFLYPEPGNFATADSYLWFDLCGQRMGGTVYAAGQVRLHLKAEAHLPFRQLSVVVDGRRGKWVVPVAGGRFDLELTATAAGDVSYYRIEAFAGDQDPAGDPARPGHLPDAWTNPIFVRRIVAPPDAWAFFDQDPDFAFDAEAGRFLPQTAEITASAWDGCCWWLDFNQPEVAGVIRCGGPAAPVSVRLDGRSVDIITHGTHNWSFVHDGGRHQLELFYS